MNLTGGSFVFFRFLSVNAGNCLQLCSSQLCVQSLFKMDKNQQDGRFHWIKSCSFKNTASVFFNIFPPISSNVLGEGSSVYGGGDAERGDILRMFYETLIYSSFLVPFCVLMRVTAAWGCIHEEDNTFLIPPCLPLVMSQGAVVLRWYLS